MRCRRKKERSGRTSSCRVCTEPICCDLTLTHIHTHTRTHMCSGWCRARGPITHFLRMTSLSLTRSRHLPSNPDRWHLFFLPWCHVEARHAHCANQICRALAHLDLQVIATYVAHVVWVCKPVGLGRQHHGYGQGSRCVGEQTCVRREKTMELPTDPRTSGNVILLLLDRLYLLFAHGTSCTQSWANRHCGIKN